MPRIIIEKDGEFYASIDIEQSNHYWIELSGFYWCLRVGNAFNLPLKRWRETKNQKTLEDMIPLALSHVLRVESETNIIKEIK